MRGYTISISRVLLSNFEAGFRLTWPHGVAREPRPHGLCPTRGTSAPQGLRFGGASLRRSASPSGPVLHGSTFVHDLRPTHDTIQPSRDGQLPAGAGTTPLSLRYPGFGGQEHSGRRQLASRL